MLNQVKQQSMNKLDSLLQKLQFGMLTILVSIGTYFGSSILSELKSHRDFMIKAQQQLEDNNREHNTLFADVKENREVISKVKDRTTALEFKTERIEKVVRP